MKYVFHIIILISLLSILVTISCSDNNNDNTYEFGTEITIQHGETISVGNNGLQFRLDSINEGRCASDVVCVWQGVAEVIFRQIQLGQPEAFNLNIMGLCEEDCGENKDMDSYNVELIELSPYPISTIPVTQEDYNAVIIVTET